MKNYLFPAIALLSIWPVSALAGAGQQVPVGPRAIGMGGAFSAIADDYSALFWNPAGLVQIGHQEIAFTNADLYGVDIRDNYLAFVLPLSPNLAAAADWYHSGFGDNELDFGENRIDLAAAMNLTRRLSLGVAVKYLSRDTELDQSSVRKGNGLGADLGLQFRPLRNLRLALVGQDIFDTELEYSGGVSTPVYRRTIRAGAAYTHRGWATVAAGLDDRIHLGTEIQPHQLVALRGGFQTSADEDATWSFGAGFQASIFHVDYAYEIHPVLDATHHIGVALAFNFNPARIRIEKVEIRNLYSSFYKTYAREPIGTVRVRNLKDEPLTTKLSLFIPELMDGPTEREVVLRPRATQDVPMTAVLSSRVMGRTEDGSVRVEVSGSYQSARLLRSDKGTGETLVFAPGAINWNGGLDQAAAFVTSRDPVVDALARESIRSAALAGEPLLGNRNLTFMAAVFNALETLGIVYVPDPNNPYAAMSDTENAVDAVQYPRETLRKRTGDCDDTSVLMAALLESVGVPTKLVDTPGHLSILAGTGIHERNRYALPLDESLYVVEDGELWIPVETTALGEGFTAAWKRGSEGYKSWEARGKVATADVTRSQVRYEPALPARSTDQPALDTATLQTVLAGSAAIIEAWRQEFMDVRYGMVGDPASTSTLALNQLARVFYTAGKRDLALAKLEEALQDAPRSGATRNNQGVLQAAGGDLVEAVASFQAALQLDEDPGVWLNLGVVLHVVGKRTEAEEPLAQGLALSGGLDDALGLLGLPEDEAFAVAGGEEEREAISARDMLIELLEKAGSGLSADEDTGARSGPVLLQFLYWKE